MKLNGRETGILDYLAETRSATVGGLAKALKIKDSNASAYLKKLAGYGLVSVTRSGRKKEVRLANAVLVGFAGLRGLQPPLKLSFLLAGRTPFVLASIKTGVFRADDLGLPYLSARRLLEHLGSCGIIYSPYRGVYLLREEMKPVKRFCEDVVMLAEFNKADAELGGVRQLKLLQIGPRDATELLVVDHEAKKKGYWPTAYSVFHKYGIQLITGDLHYYANKKPALSDAILHALVMASEQRDARQMGYVCAAIVKNKFNPNGLFGPSKGVIDAEQVNRLASFIRSKGRETYPGFPSWSEVEAIANG